jgi:hypothetical protein
MNEMRRRLMPEQLETPIPPSPPATAESLQKRRWRLVVGLAVLNCIYLANAIYQVATWPSSVSLRLSAEQVTVLRDTTGKTEYEARVPLKEFPYDMQLRQQHRDDLLYCSLFNVLLLLAILHSYWQQARLERTPIDEPSP